VLQPEIIREVRAKVIPSDAIAHLCESERQATRSIIHGILAQPALVDTYANVTVIADVDVVFCGWTADLPPRCSNYRRLNIDAVVEAAPRLTNAVRADFETAVRIVDPCAQKIELPDPISKPNRGQ
jgi:hypothetical protein